MSDWHVVKVGGSLFDCPDLPQRLRTWLSQQKDQRIVLIAGGGEFVDVIRRADQNWHLGEEASHWLCVDAMRLTARMLGQLLPEAELIGSWQQLIRLNRNPGEWTIFETGAFLREIEPGLPPPGLSHTWQVTSDSIAARVTVALGASHLTLLKSAAPPASSVLLLEELGYVDPHFAIASAVIPNVSFVNLRN